MKYLLIDKSLAVKGQIDFKKEDFFSLKPSSYVTQIGDGRETGSYRTDFFTQPFKYVGSFNDTRDSEEYKYYAFQVPVNMLPENSEPHYLLYESTGVEILRRTKSYVRFFAAVFGTI
ncbi:hypothetical protein [Lentimicrobium sp. S6]|uniref:hypothetical protein n=1 Tax=Lentimicrobium sp. S6 TaxID=2735872 RepID=UPI0015551C52|nr:hypothetical protein [Lentimicrobium sp. S6]NPD48080.1 hypothetical protein [Lentimicrobium sp. S6]